MVATPQNCGAGPVVPLRSRTKRAGRRADGADFVDAELAAEVELKTLRARSISMTTSAFTLDQRLVEQIGQPQFDAARDFDEERLRLGNDLDGLRPPLRPSCRSSPATVRRRTPRLSAPVSNWPPNV